MCCEDKHVDLLLIDEGEKKRCILIKDFNTFMYDYTLRRGRKYFCRYCLLAFRTVDVFKCHITNCFKINGKQKMKMPTKGEYVKFKIYERKIKPSFMTYVDFQIIQVPKDNGKQNPYETYTNKRCCLPSWL